MSDRPHQLSNLAMRFTLIFGVPLGQLALEEGDITSHSRMITPATPASTSSRPKTKPFKCIATSHHGCEPNTEPRSKPSDQTTAVNTPAALLRNPCGEKVQSVTSLLMTLPSTTALRNLLTAVYSNESEPYSTILAYRRHCGPKLSTLLFGSRTAHPRTLLATTSRP